MTKPVVSASHASRLSKHGPRWAALGARPKRLGAVALVVVCFTAAGFAVLRSCGTKQRTSFVDLCIKVVERPSQYLPLMFESRYWCYHGWRYRNRFTGPVIDLLSPGDRALSQSEFAEMAVLLNEGVARDKPESGAAHDQYCAAASTVVIDTLAALDAEGRLPDSLPPRLFDRKACREWYAKHKAEIEKLERMPAYVEVAEHAKAAVLKYRREKAAEQ